MRRFGRYGNEHGWFESSAATRIFTGRLPKETHAEDRRSPRSSTTVAKRDSHADRRAGYLEPAFLQADTAASRTHNQKNTQEVLLLIHDAIHGLTPRSGSIPDIAGMTGKAVIPACSIR
jgi:hypothetical protein